MGNKTLRNAKKNKNDEFYTKLEDIEKELVHYTDKLKGKIIYCNCDNPKYSNFWKYFYDNFESLDLKELIATYYNQDGNSEVHKYDGENHTMSILGGDGDFRSDESIELLKESDIVCTNPPFSLFRECVAQLMEYEKDFIVIGNMNAIAYKEIFPLLKSNRMWLGHNYGGMEFIIPNDAPEKSGQRVDEDGIRYQKFGNITWYTNLDIPRLHERMILFRTYNKVDYPTYDNYDAIEVNKVADIPKDYDGVMGVPITFLTKHNPEQFTILGSHRWAKSEELIKVYRGTREDCIKDKKTLINNKETYSRIFIRRR